MRKVVRRRRVVSARPRRRIATRPVKARAAEAIEGIELADRSESGVYTESGSGLITRMGSQVARGKKSDRVKPRRPPFPTTAKTVERHDRRPRAANPRDDRATRARDAWEKGADPDGVSSTPAIERHPRRPATSRKSAPRISPTARATAATATRHGIRTTVARPAPITRARRKSPRR